jgi:hypothetical protein
MAWYRPESGFRSESRRELSRQEALACVPVKRPQVDVSLGDDGLVRLAYPMPVSSWVLRAARWLGRSNPTHQIKKTDLDRLGSEVWGLMDGRRTVKQIIDAFAATHQLLEQEAEVAVTQFIRQLGQRGVIGLK